jgi:hypothetical protein
MGTNRLRKPGQARQLIVNASCSKIITINLPSREKSVEKPHNFGIVLKKTEKDKMLK